MTKSAPDNPSFIGIGANRSGTTWLYSVLKDHPNVYMTEVKELQYFNWAFGTPGNAVKDAVVAVKKRLLPRALQTRLLGRHFNNERVRNILLRDQPNDQWYLDLFSDVPQGTVSGEICPSYAALPDEVVAHMAQLLPSTKIIFVMREPMERLWSQYRYRITNRKLAEGDLGFLTSDHAMARSGYDVTMEKFEKHFPADQIHYCFYEDMVDDPEEFVNEICAFLGVAPLDPQQRAALGKRVNTSKKIDIPAEVEKEWRPFVDSMITKVEARLGRVPGTWTRNTP